jgi:NDP-sugar pyrophosphorylase family protein
MKLFINTGGKGERLYPLTKEIPKPLVRIYNKPVLHHLVDWAKQHDIKEIIMMNGHMKEKIIDYFGNGDDFGVTIIHSNEPYALGSGGALKFAEKHADGRFAYISGDVLSEVNLIKMENFHEKKNSEMTVFLHESSHAHDSDILDIDNDSKVIRFISKNEDHMNSGKLTNAGLAILEPEIFDLMDIEVFNFENYLYKKVIENKNRFYGYVSNEFIHDMGTFERLKKCEDYLNTKSSKITI